MTKTTIKSLTEAQIKTLRSEATKAGEYMLAVTCDLALEGKIDLNDYTVLEHHEANKLRSMTQEQAYEAVVDAINNGMG